MRLTIVSPIGVIKLWCLSRRVYLWEMSGERVAIVGENGPREHGESTLWVEIKHVSQGSGAGGGARCAKWKMHCKSNSGTSGHGASVGHLERVDRATGLL